MVVTDPNVVRLNEPFAIFKSTLAFPGSGNKHFFDASTVRRGEVRICVRARDNESATARSGVNLSAAGRQVGIPRGFGKTEAQHTIMPREIAGQAAIGEAGRDGEAADGLGLIIADL